MLTTEIEIEVYGGRIIQANVMDGKCKLVVEVTAKQDDVFVKVEASELRLSDDFMKHQPKTEKERELKKMIETTIRGGLKDFWRPKYDPSFNESGTGICYIPGKSPAMNRHYEWWTEVAREFNPERKSRLGTKSEYIAFLAVLIKKLIQAGWTVSDAWNAVCNDSKELGHYYTSKDNRFEDTGNREICGFFDLANTLKILAEEEENSCLWWMVDCCGYSKHSPLANLILCKSNCDFWEYGVGWLVLEEGN